MKVTAIIVSYNSRDYIPSCLESLLAQDRGSHELEILVIDNDSSDDSVKHITQKFPSAQLIRHPTNMGYAGGNNTGLIRALDTGADFAWVINPDLTLAPDALKNFLEASTQHTHDGIFGGKIYFAPGHEFHKDRYTPQQLGHVIWFAGGVMDWRNLIGSHRGVNEVDQEQYNYNVETDYIAGTCMFIKRRVLEEVGLFDPKYFLYYEENDFCQRAKRRGFKCIFLYKPTAWHANAQSTDLGSGKNTDLQDYYIARNRILFGLRYAPLWTKQALLREALKIYQQGRPWQKQGVKDFFTGHLGAGSFTSA